MSRSTPTRTLLGIGWCLAVPIAVLGIYLILGTIITVIGAAPVVVTVMLNLSVIVTAMLLRSRWQQCSASDHPAPVDIRFIAFLGICLIPTFLAGQSLSLWLYDLVGSPAYEAHEAQQSTHDAGGIALLLVVSLVIAPVGEEVLFRGVIQSLLRQRVGVIASVLTTTAAFAIVHGNLVQASAVIPLAVLLSLVYERTGRLLLCVLLHIAFNLAAVLIPPSALLWTASLPAVIFWLIGLSYPLVQLWRRDAPVGAVEGAVSGQQ